MLVAQNLPGGIVDVEVIFVVLQNGPAHATQHMRIMLDMAGSNVRVPNG